MNRDQKIAFVEKLKGIFSDYKLVVVMENKGIDVPTVNELRAKVKSTDSRYMVIKNTLAKIALSSLGLESCGEMFKGPTSIAFSNDPVSVSKVMKEFSNDAGPLSIVGALLDGAMVDESTVCKLASMPSLDELRARIIGMIQAPARKVYGAVTAPASSLVSILTIHSEGKK